MFNKNILLLSILCTVVTSSIAQENKPSISKAIITLEPLALADVFDGASCRIGAEIKLGGQFSLALTGGTYLNYLKATKMNPKGFLVKSAIKYYLHKNTSLSGRYVALEYQYKNQDYDFKDTMEFDDLRYEKQYAMNRKINSLSFKYGNVKRYGKYFVLEWHAGLGIRYIQSVSGLSDFESDAILTGEEGNCPIQEDFIRRTGSHFYPNFILGVKIGYSVL
jgi:hypothetical protein